MEIKIIRTKKQALAQVREELQSAVMYDKSGMPSAARDERKHAFFLKKKFKIG